MALLVGTNSWTTVVEADDYLQNRMSSEQWFLLPVTGLPGTGSKENLLVTAYYEIQASPIVDISANSTDLNVKHAQIEMSMFLLKYYDSISDGRAAIASGISSFRYSERSESYNTRDGGGAISLPANVTGLLNDYIQSNTTVQLKV